MRVREGDGVSEGSGVCEWRSRFRFSAAIVALARSVGCPCAHEEGEEGVGGFRCLGTTLWLATDTAERSRAKPKHANEVGLTDSFIVVSDLQKWCSRLPSVRGIGYRGRILILAAQ